ncbi:MAG: polyprenyl synthetase family protein, partial [Chloroflexi bacterium]|nr:polyprenyl synthetase family protein [Chloroflexota bacterium]
MQALSIYGPVREGLAQVEENLKSVSTSSFDHLSDLLTYVLDVPGKRIRPAITLLTGKLRPHDDKLTVLMATALELLHIATLIHDDTVDD